MDQRKYSPLASSSGNSPQSTAALTNTLPEPSKDTLLALATGRDPTVSDEGAEIDVADSVHTDAIKTINPAVTHEHVQPLHHIKHEQRITREIHTHDVYHRILPVVETEILPARHFIDDGSGEIRPVPASEVWKYNTTVTVTAAGGGYRKPPDKTLAETESPHPQHETDTYNSKSPEEQTPHQQQQLPATTSQAPILADQKTYMTDGGYPRTEYLWLHPPVFVDACGNTQPVLIPAGLSSEWKARLGVLADPPPRAEQDESTRQVVVGVVVAEEEIVAATKTRPSSSRVGSPGPGEQLVRETEEEEARRRQTPRK